MARTAAPDIARTERRILRIVLVVALLVGALLVSAIATRLTDTKESRFDASLPNPMGGPASTAPGDVTGEVAFGGLRIEGNEVAMGEVGLGVTFVPTWEITNDSRSHLTFTAGQPQVLEGCCPGPVYVDGELTQVGERLVVPAGGSVVLQFPLQMHAGMDGPHHLAIPLRAGGEDTAVHVTGDFTATASAAAPG